MFNNFPKASRDSMLNRVLISFLTSAGLYYINIMPTLVDTLVNVLHFTNNQAGMVSSINAYGSAIGAFIIVFFISKIKWQLISPFLLLGLIIVDLLSIFIESYTMLLGIRLVHGLIGGALIGLGFSIIAKTKSPDKTFSVLLLVQFGFGGLGLILIPELVIRFGIVALYLALIIFSIITFLMMPFIPSMESIDQTQLKKHDVKILPSKALVFSLLSIFIFQASNMGLYAFIFGLGKHFGLELEFVSVSLGIAAWMGIIGALISVNLSTRLGFSIPLFWGISLTALASYSLIYSELKSVWIIANFSIGITWSFVMPYLLSICSKLDKSGQSSALGGVASKLGLATGPFVFGIFLNESDYNKIIIIAVALMFISVITSLLSVHYSAKIHVKN